MGRMSKGCTVTLLLSKSLSGEEVARLLVDVLSTKLGVLTTNVVAATRDRASVNSLAMRTVCVLYNRVFDVGCLSHTLDHVGEKLDTPFVDEFFHPLSTIVIHTLNFAHTHKFKVWMTIVESRWNVWVWLVGMGGIYGCG